MVERRDILHLGLGAMVPALYRGGAADSVQAPVGGIAVPLAQLDLATAGGAARIGIADGGTLQNAIAVARTPAALLASSVAPTEGSTIRTADGFAYEVARQDASDHDLTTAGGAKLYHDPGAGVANALAFGAIGDGKTDNTSALQAALDFAAKHRDGIRAIYLPSGVYKTGTIYIPTGVRLFGDSGVSQTTGSSGTKLVQAGAGDVIRFRSYSGQSGKTWWGEIDHLAIWGDNARTSGWGINFKDASGEAVVPQDSNFLHHLTIRRCSEGGINVPSGAFPMCIADCNFLFNNGPGIKLARTAQFQGVHFLNISGDGNNGGLISLSRLNNRGGAVLVTSLKSEARVNADYGGREHQFNAIVLSECGDCPIVINGATHTSSIRDGGTHKKPGNLIEVRGEGPSPRVCWTGVAIRVRDTDTGTDPLVIGGSGLPADVEASYRLSSGSFNDTNRLLGARIALSWGRAGSGGAAPSAAQHNALLLDHGSPVSIASFSDAIEGQVLHLIADNGNTTLVNGHGMQLTGGRNYAMGKNDSCTLIFMAGVWRELNRSMG